MAFSVSFLVPFSVFQCFSWKGQGAHGWWSEPIQSFWQGWGGFSLSFLWCGSIQFLEHGRDECSLSLCDVHQFSLLGVVGMKSVFPFVIWTNSVFWAWLGWIQSFLLWCEPIQSFGHGCVEFSLACCAVNEFSHLGMHSIFSFVM